MNKIKSVLIANRGEIAVRIDKTLRKLGIKSYGIYSHADKKSIHTNIIGNCYLIKSQKKSSSPYLDVDQIITIAKKNKITAIHPGYGFLSENADFASRCEKEKIIFIGPSAHSIRLMGSKTSAKNTIEKINIPLIPGYFGKNQDIEFIKEKANKIGYPLLLKASHGGGGKGMRVIEKKSQLEKAFYEVKNESKMSFGNDEVMVEKYIESPRHIEIQIIGDKHGNYISLNERDCSIQRRYQKIIEEAPSVHVDEALRNKMNQASILIAKKIKYFGAGTLEYIVDKKNNFYFMEMNTRLQVEHSVTEMTTGVDIVELQIKIAEGQKLPVTQTEIYTKGHAIEARIYCEDPLKNYLPSIGILDRFKINKFENCRIDLGVKDKTFVGPSFDPMIAKVTAYGDTRLDSVNLLKKQLQNIFTSGLETNINLLIKILGLDEYFVSNKKVITTKFLDENLNNIIFDLKELNIDIFAIYIFSRIRNSDLKNLSWQKNVNFQETFNIFIFNKPYEFKVRYGLLNFEIIYGKIKKTYFIDETNDNLRLFLNKKELEFEFLESEKNTAIHYLGLSYNIPTSTENLSQVKKDSNIIYSPMPGLITNIMVKEGQEVEHGSELFKLSAMKMEHTISSESSGVVNIINCKIGDLVAEKDILLELKK